ncbi:MAG: hypothetical protein JW744_02360 [Candidatus Diapherotrites archaeon]|uniref:Uncharacterized protein n=1 Tax=Candidatus Iainarchaeum sp. TaxID=3101447 RepID=A0A938YR06_9ARCH|nr:hypothetical protein [Candidatus Diapherotrites archaeon]
MSFSNSETKRRPFSDGIPLLVLVGKARKEPSFEDVIRKLEERCRP